MKISGMGLLIGALVVASVSLVRSADDEAVKQAAVAKPIAVRGRALDSDGEPIKGAVVFLVSTGLIEKTLGQTVTDGEGRYDFRDMPLPIGEQQKRVLSRPERSKFLARPRAMPSPGAVTKPYGSILKPNCWMPTANRSSTV